MTNSSLDQPSPAYDALPSSSARPTARLGDLVLEGLRSTPKRLPSALFYDGAGSDLFSSIMELDAYYLSRAETDILTRYSTSIVRVLPPGPIEVVDLGAGDARKTAILLRAILAAGRGCEYVPVDVSGDALEGLSARLTIELPDLVVRPLVAEYDDAIHLLRGSSNVSEGRRLVLFLGSNIGNFEDEDAHGFFARLRGVLGSKDHALIGFDLVKRPEELLRAYDDPEGVTAQFNLNLLARINREVGADFDPAAFQHHALFNPVKRRMESYLLSKHTQTVRVAGHIVPFQAWEPIHTEVSRKYADYEIDQFAERAGFVVRSEYTDDQHRFVDALFAVGASG